MGPGDIKSRSPSITPTKVGVPDSNPGIAKPQTKPTSPRESSTHTSSTGLSAMGTLRKKAGDMGSSISTLRSDAFSKMKAAREQMGHAMEAMPQKLEAFSGHMGSLSRGVEKTADAGQIVLNMVDLFANTPIGKRYGVDRLSDAMKFGLGKLPDIHQNISALGLGSQEAVALLKKFSAENMQKPEAAPEPKGGDSTAPAAA